MQLWVSSIYFCFKSFASDEKHNEYYGCVHLTASAEFALYAHTWIPICLIQCVMDVYMYSISVQEVRHVHVHCMYQSLQFTCIIFFSDF